jgi:hypothetical protein
MKHHHRALLARLGCKVEGVVAAPRASVEEDLRSSANRRGIALAKVSDA